MELANLAPIIEDIMIFGSRRAQARKSAVQPVVASKPPDFPDLEKGAATYLVRRAMGLSINALQD